MLSQEHITPVTPMGATLTDGGATFRVWAPRATAVYLCGEFGGVAQWGQTPANLMVEAGGYWTGFVPGVADGDPYKLYVIGRGSQGFKRDPYARDLTPAPSFPHCNCVVRDPRAYVWRDAGFQIPDYSDMVVYQLHVGSYVPTAGVSSTFLDVVGKLPYLAALGVNVVQLLPIDEAETAPSLGYNGSDYFSPETTYVVSDPAALPRHVNTVNRLLAAKGRPPLAGAGQLIGGYHQLKVLVDLCHVYGLAVVFDVVYNHAGGFMGDEESLYFWDRAANGNNNNSLYFTDQAWAGGLSFALWNRDVRQFLISSASYYLDEFHIDGLRYDEISALVSMNASTGWSFCQDVTSTVRWKNPRVVQNAEFWPVNGAVVSAPPGGAGFDVTQHDGLRRSVRAAIATAAQGAGAHVDLDAVAGNLYPPLMRSAWQAITCVENHDIVKHGEESRVAALADGADPRSWYARSRARVATSLLLFAPGLPMLFMGQEFLEKNQWSDDPAAAGFQLEWAALEGGDKRLADHLRFTQEAIELRRRHPALRASTVNAFHVHDDNRVLAFHRWLDGVGRDVVVVASLAEGTYWRYAVGFPRGGRWLEVFNSDVYDNWVNPITAGNGGAIDASGPPRHGFATSAEIVIPANGVVVFALDADD